MQMAFVGRQITPPQVFQSMPFSPDRTKEIQLRIDARLQSGQANDWEVSFLTNMAERFQKYGTNTRLSKAQYASLHKVLKLEREPPSQSKAQTNDSASRPAQSADPRLTNQKRDQCLSPVQSLHLGGRFVGRSDKSWCRLLLPWRFLR
jgi:hypothetical protein